MKKITRNGTKRKQRSTKPKKGKYYLDVGNVSGRKAVAVLSQLRFVDRKRLSSKIATMDQDVFKTLNTAVVNVCFPGFLK